jgi:hypothetical protein
MNFRTIEDAIIRRIKSQLPYLETVESFDGNLIDLEDLTKRVPAVFVNISQATPAVPYWTFTTKAFTYQIVLNVLARGMRGKPQMATDKTGAYAILNDLRTALVDYDLTANSLPLVLVAETFYRATEVAVCYKVTYAFTDIT